MSCGEFNLFYYDNTLLSPEVLEEAYNKLPADYKTTLTLREGDIEIGGFKQFLAFYAGKKLKFRDKQRAEDMFLTIFLDNGILLEQIKKAKEAIRELSNIDKNWKDSTLYTNNTTTEGTNTMNQSNADKSTTNNTQKTLTLGLNSDSNSSGLIEGGERNMIYITGEEEPQPLPEKIEFPVNTISKSSNLYSDTVSSDTTSVLINVGKTTGKDIITTRTTTSNVSEDWREYMHLDLPALRRKFWSKFTVMFLF